MTDSTLPPAASPSVTTPASDAAAATATTGVPNLPGTWSLDPLRGADPVLGLALLMALAVVLAEELHRRLRLPRVCGHMLVGVLASPLLLRLLERAELDPWKPLLDLAIAVLVFELGSRIRLRWLLDNPGLAVSCVLEGLLAGLAVMLTLMWMGVSALSAAAVGAVAMSTSPVIVMAVMHESKPRGQVTERLLIMTAINSVLAMLALKIWRVIAATPGHDLANAATGAFVVVVGSLLLGIACALLLEKLTPSVRDTPAMPVLQIALVISASLLAAQWTLSPLLALLVASVVARNRMRHGLNVEPQLGSAGSALSAFLFICLGVLLTMDGVATVWPWVLAIIVARLVGKGVAIAALAKPSGLGWQQAAALTLALQPMSSLAVLLAADTFAWSTQLPGMETDVIRALLVATTLMQLTGPLWTTWSLRHLAKEGEGS
ncbi:MAG: cation:proton antiporter [Pseudomonadota bacterium]